MGRVLDGGILIARLPKGQLGEETAKLMGSFVFASVWQAATARARLPEPERRDAVYYIDEAHNVLNLAGSPQIRGCGWYVDIEHPGGLVTRYCHMLTHPYVEPGQAVTVGEVIGIVGTSGNSSGPHLHYEVHHGDHSAGSATDPVPFMASVEAPLGP